MVKTFLMFFLAFFFLVFFTYYSAAGIKITQYKTVYNWYVLEETPSLPRQGMEFSVKSSLAPGLTSSITYQNDWETDIRILTGETWNIDTVFRKKNYQFSGTVKYDWEDAGGRRTNIAITDYYKLNLRYFLKNGNWYNFFMTMENRSQASPWQVRQYDFKWHTVTRPWYLNLYLNYEKKDAASPEDDYYEYRGNLILKYTMPKFSGRIDIEAENKNYSHSFTTPYAHESLKYTFFLKRSPYKGMTWESGFEYFQYRGDHPREGLPSRNADIFSVNGRAVMARRRAWEFSAEFLWRWGSRDWDRIYYWYKDYLTGNIEIKGILGVWSFSVSPYLRKNADYYVKGVRTGLFYDRKPWSLRMYYSPGGYSYAGSEKGFWGSVTWKV